MGWGQKEISPVRMGNIQSAETCYSLSSFLHAKHTTMQTELHMFWRSLTSNAVPVAASIQSRIDINTCNFIK